MNKSIRQVAKEAGVDHSALSKIINNKYPANPQLVIAKVLKSLGGGIHIAPDKCQEVLDMLDNARFPQKFSSCHRTASWLYDLIRTGMRSNEAN